MNRPSRHILFIAPSAYPLGGVATWLDYIVPGLRHRGWNVTLGLVQGRFHDVDAYLNAHPDDQVLRISYGTGTKEGRVRKLVQAICNAQPDVVVNVNIADVVQAVDRVRAISESSPRVVATIHALQADFISSVDNCAGILDAVICTNRLGCEMVSVSTSIEADRIYYASYGVDVNDVSEHQGGQQDILRIAYVGRLERGQKRVQDIGAIVCELCRRGVDFELSIVGDGPDGEWLRDQLSDAVCAGRVRFLATLCSKDLAEHVYRRADALLITSLWETGPIVAWEAMAHGLVVVTSEYVGSGLEGSLVPGDNCLMFPVGDPVSAADCLGKLQAATLRARLLQGGRRLVINRYSQKASIDRWDDVIRTIAEKPTRSFANARKAVIPTLPAGRLDLLGSYVGETIREWLHLKYNHTEPGGEWPHANFHSDLDEERFWRLAKSLDRRQCREDVVAAFHQ